jgi:topoisomerase-4 subunit A
LTIILSEKGWVRSAKGHDIDALTLAYRTGDGFLAAALGRTNQPAYFLDSTGRAYSLPSHDLPSARSQGEPLTGRLNPPPGAVFKSVLAGQEEDWYLLASDAGYGFLTQLAELNCKNRAGKTVLTLPEHSQILSPVRVGQPEADWLAVVTAQGRLLVFPAGEIPVLNKGKGNKLIDIKASDLHKREDYIVAIASLSPGAALKINAGKRSFTLQPNDLEHYKGTRARRGNPLPQGFRRVDKMGEAQ